MNFVRKCYWFRIPNEEPFISITHKKYGLPDSKNCGISRYTSIYFIYIYFIYIYVGKWHIKIATSDFNATLNHSFLMWSKKEQNFVWALRALNSELLEEALREKIAFLLILTGKN